jgi:hypothetical protein
MATESHKKPRVIDDPTIREVYGNKLISVSFDGGAVILTIGVSRFVPNRIDEPPTEAPPVYASGRIALSPAAAVEFVNGVSGILNTVANAQAAAIRAGQMPPPGRESELRSSQELPTMRPDRIGRTSKPTIPRLNGATGQFPTACAAPVLARSEQRRFLVGRQGPRSPASS